ncbi:MAG: hypothetical protein NW215_07150 [Hyphomicrobiales bacterium]|nr:hypothetical protein [Hyphomicrobiales bacterium]
MMHVFSRRNLRNGAVLIFRWDGDHNGVVLAAFGETAAAEDDGAAMLARAQNCNSGVAAHSVILFEDGRPALIGRQRGVDDFARF